MAAEFLGATGNLPVSQLNGCDPIEGPTPTLYQMIPVGETRPGRFKSSGGIWAIAQAHPNVVELYNEANTAPLWPADLIGSIAELRFTIRGLREGRTVILAMDQDGNAAQIIVSVKTPVTKLYGCWVLIDERRDAAITSRTSGWLQSAMLVAETSFLQQANVKLSCVRRNGIVDFPNHNLGNPMYLENALEGYWAWSTTIEDEIEARVGNAGGANADLNLVAVPWDIEYSWWKARNFPISGSTSTTIYNRATTIVELMQLNQLNIANINHEACHYLLSDHGYHNNWPTSQTDGYLMVPAVPQGFRLAWDEIDSMNPSGMKFGG